eukprot:403341239
MLGQYESIAKLGSGTFGNVYRCVDLKTGEIVAIKKLKKSYQSIEDAFSLREIQVLQQLSHPNVVQMKRCELDNERVHMVFEHQDYNLTDFMREKKRAESRSLSEQEIRVIIKQILLACDYIHSRGFIHRDIKPENFIIGFHSYEVKMIDFGTVKDLGKNTGPMTSYVSTRWYRSPECVLRSQNYNQKADLFAVGCVMAELFNANPLFTGTSELDQLDAIFKLLGTPRLEQFYKLAQKRNIKLENFAYKKKPMNFIIPGASEEALEIMKQMFKINPNKRASASQLLQDPYFSRCNVKTDIQRLKNMSPNIRNIEVKAEPQTTINTQREKVKQPDASLYYTQQHEETKKVSNKNLKGNQRFGSDIEYHPNYFEYDKPKPAQQSFQAGLNYSLKSEVERNKSTMSQAEEAIMHDFAAFKRRSDPVMQNNNGQSSTGDLTNFKSMQAFPGRRDEPASFQQRFEEVQRQQSNPVGENFVFNDQSQSILNSPANKFEKVNSQQQQSQSMLARIGSQSLMPTNALLVNPGRYHQMNLSVKIDKANYPNTNTNSPIVSPLIGLKSQTGKFAQIGMGEQNFNNFQQQQDEKIDSFSLGGKNDNFVDQILSPGLPRSQSKPEGLFNFNQNREIFSTFQNLGHNISKQDSLDSQSTYDTSNVMGKYVNYYQNSNAQAQQSKQNSPTYQYRQGLGLDKVEETREEHEYYNKDNDNNYSNSSKPSYNKYAEPTKSSYSTYQSTRGGNEPNSGNNVLSKHPNLFINNATNIFGSPAGGFKNVFPNSNNNNFLSKNNSDPSGRQQIQSQRLDSQSSTSDQILSNVMNRYRTQIQI